ncbi:MAG TPA: response regulator [Vicinamibacteria bacterium]|nr:response regulator [Vicinamibacteria bacterium]
MSLSGSVEDLPLLEILQVVSFCQKTGHLAVRAPAGEAAVLFEGGRVVAGYVWDVPPLARDRPPGGAERELVVRQRIASILERLVRLREGEFAFTLTEDVPMSLGGRDLSAERLPNGINPEEMMLDLARQLDEDRRDAAAAFEASFTAPGDDEPPAEVEDGDIVLEAMPPEEAAAPAPPAGPPVLFVDDEVDVRRVVGERLTAAGFDVREADGPAAARREMGRLADEGRRFLLVADLGLPSDSGSSFRGGLDVVRAASGLRRPPPVLLMGEAFDARMRARAKRLGVSLLAFKPGLSKLDPLQYRADLRAFGEKLARDLLPRLETRRRGVTPVAPLPLAAGEPGMDARETALRSALEEMQRSADPDLVAFLLLQAARAFFPRVLLFVVRDENLRGLSGFGPADGGDSLDLVAREIAVPLDLPSPFSEAVASGRPWTGRLPRQGPVRALVDRIGARAATDAAILPVTAHRETIAVLYGDAPDGGSLPALAPLLDFVERAGRTLDEGFLARRAPAAAAC